MQIRQRFSPTDFYVTKIVIYNNIVNFNARRNGDCMTRTASSTPFRQSGFTLIEIIIAVAIVGILSAVALPSYRDYVTRGRIPEATSALATYQVKMEQWFQDNRKYRKDDACGALPNDYTDGKSFDISCTASSDTAYTLTATGKSTMSGFTFTINQAGTKKTTAAPTGWNTSNTCWVSAKGETC